MRWTDFFRDVASGAGIGNISSSLKRHVDDVEIATDTSDNTAGNRKGEVNFAQSGHPGPVYHEETISGQVNRRSSLAMGSIFTEEIPDMLEFLGEGVFPGIDDELEVFADGSGMQVKVRTGKGIQKGHLYRHNAESTLAIAASDPTNPRKDRVVKRLTRPGQVEAGKHELVVKTGTAAASPVKPALTQSSATWETALATVDVPATAASIVAANVVDERQPVVPPATGWYPFVVGRKYDQRAFWSLGPELLGVSITTNRLYAVPFFVPWTTTFDRIGINVVSSSAGNARLGVHLVGFDGQPGALVLDAGTVSVSTTGEKEITISQSLVGGRWYVLAVVTDAASVKLAGVDVVDASPPLVRPSPFGIATFGSRLPSLGVYRAFTYAALPDPFGTSGLTFPTDGVPLIGLRAA